MSAGRREARLAGRLTRVTVPIERLALDRTQPSPVVGEPEHAGVSMLAKLFEADGAAAIEPNNALAKGIAPAPTLNVPDISAGCCSDPLPHCNLSFWLMLIGSV